MDRHTSVPRDSADRSGTGPDRVWVALGSLMAILAVVNIGLAFSGDVLGNLLDAAFCVAFAFYAFKLSSARRAYTYTYTSNVPDLYGREVSLTTVPPESDEGGQFRLALSVDGKERYAAYFTDKRDYE